MNEFYKCLFNLAIHARDKAWAPYSNFKVGAALGVTPELPDIRISSIEMLRISVVGANFESASYGGTICAERSAIVATLQSGISKFDCLAVVGQSAKSEAPSGIITPCGICRQLLIELANKSGIDPDDFKIILGTIADGPKEIITLGELLPRSFGPKDLGFV